MQCEEFRDLIEGYLAESLDDDRRALFRTHLRSCPTCRERAMAVDPTLVFAATDHPQPDAEEIESCTRNVLAQIRQRRLMGTVAGRRRRWLAAAAAAAIVVAGGAVWQLTRGVDGPVRSTQVGSDQAVPEPHVPPQVQVEMDSEDVRVYQFADEDDGDTAIYYIVNPALEL